MRDIAFPENIPQSALIPPKPKALVYLIRLLYSSGVLVSVIYAVAMLVLRPCLAKQYRLRHEYLTYVCGGLRGMVSAISRRLEFVPNVAVHYGDKVYSDAYCQTDLDGNKGLVPGAVAESEAEEEEEEEQDEDAQIMTKPLGTVRFADEEEERQAEAISKLKKRGHVQGSLARLQECLSTLKVTSYKQGDSPMSMINNRANISEMQPLLFQIKQFQNYLEMMHRDHPRDVFFKRNYLMGHNLGRHKTSNMADDITTELRELTELAKKI